MSTKVAEETIALMDKHRHKDKLADILANCRSEIKAFIQESIESAKSYRERLDRLVDEDFYATYLESQQCTELQAMITSRSARLMKVKEVINVDPHDTSKSQAHEESASSVSALTVVTGSGNAWAVSATSGASASGSSPAGTKSKHFSPKESKVLASGDRPFVISSRPENSSTTVMEDILTEAEEGGGAESEMVPADSVSNTNSMSNQTTTPFLPAALSSSSSKRPSESHDGWVANKATKQERRSSLQASPRTRNRDRDRNHDRDEGHSVSMLQAIDVAATSPVATPLPASMRMRCQPKSQPKSVASFLLPGTAYADNLQLDHYKPKWV